MIALFQFVSREIPDMAPGSLTFFQPPFNHRVTPPPHSRLSKIEASIGYYRPVDHSDGLFLGEFILK